MSGGEDDDAHVVVAAPNPDGDPDVDGDEWVYSIEHPDSCPHRDDDCVMINHAHATGFADMLQYAVTGTIWGDWQVKPGRYTVRHWWAVTPATPNGPEEYDAGLILDKFEEAS